MCCRFRGFQATPVWTTTNFPEAPAFGIWANCMISKDLDRGVKAMGGRVLRTPVRAPQANAVCERLGRKPASGVPGLPRSGQ
jgi:hypothetical protein